MTIREIAAAAGVAPSTVSLVLNNKPGVHLNKRTRIAEMLQKNGYTVRSSNVEPPAQMEIKFIIYQAMGHLHERNQDFLTGVLLGAEKVAQEEHCNLSLTNVGPEQLLATIAGLAEQPNLLGVIFLASEISRDVPEMMHTLKMLEGISLPLVLLDCPLDSCLFNRIDTDNISGSFLAIRHLYDLGHREIGFLRGSTEIGGLHGRYEGYLKAMGALGLPIRDEHIVPIDLLFDTATEQMLRHLSGKPSLPTAFFAGNDIIAAGCVRAFQQTGYSVPQDISVVGFDDGMMSTVVSPPLTTMRIDRARLGGLAVERLLFLQKHGYTETLRSELAVTLIERQSTAAPRGE